jgi:hypothetical protein
MTDSRDLHVEVHGGVIIVTLPGSIYSVTYCKSPKVARKGPDPGAAADQSLSAFVPLEQPLRCRLRPHHRSTLLRKNNAEEGITPLRTY